MNKVSKIKEVWRQLESEQTKGVVKRALDVSSCLRTYCTYKYPERFCGIAFSFHKDIKLDISVFQDLSELNVSMFRDTSFPDSTFLLIQLINKDIRVNDIFAVICGNILDAILRVDSEREGIRIVISQMRKWKNLFSKRRNQALSLQEQQGLLGELSFLRKLLKSSVDYATSINYWVGPEMAPKDFQSDMWAVEVKTVTVNNYPDITINGESQLDESDVEKLYLYNLVVETKQNDGKTLPETIADIRHILNDDIMASDLFERKLILYGYFDSDAEFYKERQYQIHIENFYIVKDEFPRIKKEDLRMGVSEVKYDVSLAVTSENVIAESNVMNIIESYEGNKQVL